MFIKQNLHKMSILVLLLALSAAQFCSCANSNVELADSVPPQLTQPVNKPGVVVRRTYSCYYYTDLTVMGGSSRARFEEKGYALERKVEAISKECNIYLPYGYNSDKKYPVVYILHGVTDNEDTWLEQTRAKLIFDNLIFSGKIGPCIAVFPNGNSSSTYLDQRFENQAGYYFFAGELVNDLIPFMESEYSVETSRDSRSLCGFSFGGMQTINVGLCQSLKYFAWFGAFSAAPTSYDSGKIAEYLKSQNAQSLYPINYFYNICGEADDVARISHEAAVQELANKSEYLDNTNYIYQTVPGNHNYSVASIGLYNFLRICFSN